MDVPRHLRTRAVEEPGAEAAGDRELVITRLLDAPRKVVFKAWTDPEQVSRWWGPAGFTVVSLEMDVRSGGAWRKCMRSPEGKDYWRRGVYREVLEPERIVFTYLSDDPNSGRGHETLVSVTFVAQGRKTLMTLHQTEFESVAARDAHRGGWTSCIERFGEYISRAQ